jgi:outer membrane protein TolC
MIGTCGCATKGASREAGPSRLLGGLHGHPVAPVLRCPGSPIRRIAGPLVVLLAGALPLLAQEAVRTLTLDQALQIALEKNRDVQKAEEYRNWVQGKYVEERAAALPQLSATAYGQRQHDESLRGLYGQYGDLFPVQQDVRSGEIGLSQALYTWGQVGAAIRAAKVGMLTAEEGLRQSRQAALRDVSAAFYDVLLSKEVLAIARQNLDQKERHSQEAQKRFALGTATDYDVLAARVAVENARPEVIRADNAVRLARLRLGFLLAESQEPVDAEGELAAPSQPAPDYGEALATALRSRPDLRSLEQTKEIYGELVKIARAGDKPRLDFKAGFGSRKYLVGDLDSHGKTWNAGIYLSFPFFDGMRTRGRVLQARSGLTTADIELQKARDQTALQVQGALDQLDEAAEVVKAIEGTVAQAERLLSMAEKGFEYGVKTRLDVDDAELALVQARGSLARARRDYLVALVNLQWAQGVLGEASAR